MYVWGIKGAENVLMQCEHANLIWNKAFRVKEEVGCGTTLWNLGA